MAHFAGHGEKPPGQAPSNANVRDLESDSDTQSTDKDVALALVGEHAQAIDPVAEARVVRKIDLFLIPAMIVGIIMDSSPILPRSIDLTLIDRLWAGVL